MSENASPEINRRNMAKILRQRQWDREKALREQAITDPLTGLLNRRGLDQKLKELELKDTKNISVVAIDIDFFKQINDKYGHNTGDEALKFVADTLISMTRPGDIIARMGGEEINVVLPNIQSRKDLLDISNRLVSIFRDKKFKNNLNISISAGLAIKKDDEDFNSMLDRADQALYKSKEAGRDRLTVAE